MSTIIVAIIGSTALSTLVQFFVNRHDAKKNVQSRLVTLEKDTLRTQLLLLLTMKPEEQQEVLTIGQHYFEKLDGNWYMTSLFNKWLEANDIAEPEWFDNKKK